MSGLTLVLLVAGPAALASPLGGLIAIWRQPTTLLLSIDVGYAGGVLLATFAFEMIPKALEYASLWLAVAGFAAGFVLVYVLDLFIHRGKVAGEKAEQHSRTRRFHLHHPPRGDETTVLAGGTSAEELIEGYRQAWQHGRAVIFTYRWRTLRKQMVDVCCGIFPLTVDGIVREAVALEEFAITDALDKPLPMLRR